MLYVHLSITQVIIKIYYQNRDLPLSVSLRKQTYTIYLGLRIPFIQTKVMVLGLEGFPTSLYP